MAPHSSPLAWKIPWTEEPLRLQSMGSWRVGHDWATSLSLFTFLHWRRKWQPTPVFLPGESQGWGAWWAAVSGVEQSQTRLKRLSSSSSRIWQPILANMLQYSCLENPPHWQKPGRPPSTGSQRVGHYQRDPARIDTRIFCLWQLCPSESWAWRLHSCLAWGDPGSTKYAGTQTASTAGLMALSESFFEPLVAGDQEASLASLSLLLHPFRHLEGSIAWAPSLLFHALGT